MPKGNFTSSNTPLWRFDTNQQLSRAAGKHPYAVFKGHTVGHKKSEAKDTKKHKDGADDKKKHRGLSGRLKGSRQVQAIDAGHSEGWPWAGTHTSGEGPITK